MKKVIGVILLSMLSTPLWALESSAGTIERMISYTKYGNADIFVSLTTNGAEHCTYGYFIRKDAPGYESAMSMLLAAYHAKKSVKISAYDTVKWPGNADNTVCEIYSVEYVN